MCLHYRQTLFISISKFLQLPLIIIEFIPYYQAVLIIFGVYYCPCGNNHINLIPDEKLQEVYTIK
jgi:hypothetical protein